jgi:hypothetical protein
MAGGFTREADLCGAFLAALPEGWTAYPETGGFDILLVREADSLQIGIQAKLRLNAKVIRQVVEEGGSTLVTTPGPDCRAVLVPQGTAGADMTEICRLLGLTVIVLPGHWHQPFNPALPRPRQDAESKTWFEWAPGQRIALPDHVPDVEAGRPAPVRLTAWKIKAIRIAVTLDRRGFVLREDFKHHKVDMRRWVAPRSGWLVQHATGWSKGPRLPDFRSQHPRNWVQIEADYDKWRLPDEVSLPTHL